LHALAALGGLRGGKDETKDERAVGRVQQQARPAQAAARAARVMGLNA